MMGGVVESKYVCNRRTWDVFLKSFLESSLHIAEQEGDLETGFFFDVATGKKDSRGAWVFTQPLVMTESNPRVFVTIDWITRNSGDDPYAVRKIAERIEQLLLEAGAICYHAPISESKAKTKSEPA